MIYADLGRDEASAQHQGAGLDFVGAEAVWDNFTVTREDLRQDYGGQRWVTFGLLNGDLVVLVHTERNGDMRIISLRKVENHEARYYLETAQGELG